MPETHAEGAPGGKAAFGAIGVIGGTGPLGSGLARRLIAAGYTVVIGSRSAEKAEATVRDLAAGTAR